MQEPKVEPRSLACCECGGAGVLFRGHGSSTEKYVCSRWQEPGHPTKAEISAKIYAEYRQFRPSGRFG